MKLRIEVREDEFEVYFVLNSRRVNIGAFPFEPDNGYIAPCFTYSFLWDSNGAVVVEYDKGEVEAARVIEATLRPGDTYECEFECSMEDPKPEG